MRAWNCFRANGIIPIVIFWLVMCGSNLKTIIFSLEIVEDKPHISYLLRGKCHQMSLGEATEKSDSYCLKTTTFQTF